MYHAFYGFRESPFNITPDPRFLFFSRRHREAYDHLLFGIRERKGFIQLTGEVGAGKTTLCRALLEDLGPDTRTALVLNPSFSGAQLYRSILSELGLPYRGNDRLRCLEVLNQFLLEEVAAGRDVVLIVDEAQDLSFELLEQIRLLSNLETDQRKLLQIVLLGQNELRDKLDQRKLRQLRQRITVRYHLGALTARETAAYLRHRLHVAGAADPDLFTPLAIARLHFYARGVPRLINAVGDKTLLCGWVQNKKKLGLFQVEKAIRELEGKT